MKSLKMLRKIDANYIFRIIVSVERSEDDDEDLLDSSNQKMIEKAIADGDVISKIFIQEAVDELAKISLDKKELGELIEELTFIHSKMSSTIEPEYSGQCFHRPGIVEGKDYLCLSDKEKTGTLHEVIQQLLANPTLTNAQIKDLISSFVVGYGTTAEKAFFDMMHKQVEQNKVKPDYSGQGFI